MQISNVILLCLLNYILAEAPNSDLCSTKKCALNRPYLVPKPINLQINLTVVKGKVMTAKCKDPVIVARISKFSSLCRSMPFYETGPLCAPVKSHVDLEKWELKTMVQKSECMIGPECTNTFDDNDCSTFFLENNPCLSSIRYKKVGPKELQNYGYSLIRGKYSCKQSWGCEIYRYEIDPSIKMTHLGPALSISVPNGKDVEVGDIVGDKMIKMPNGFHMLVPPIYFSDNEVTVGCLKEPDREICITKADVQDLKIGTVFEIDSDGNSVYGNHFLNIHDNGEGPPVTIENNKAATQEDLVETIRMLRYENSQSRYNSLIISKSINEMKVVMTNLVNALSKADPYLLGNVLNKHIKTTWLNDETIKVCTCASPQNVSKLTCTPRYMYENGKWIFRRNDTVCHRIHNISSEFQYLFENSSLSLDKLAFPTIHDIVSERDEIIDQRNAIDDLEDGGDSKINMWPSLLKCIWDKISYLHGCFVGVSSYISFYLVVHLYMVRIRTQ